MPKKVPLSLIDHAEGLVRAGSTVKDAAAEIGLHPDNLSKKLRARGVIIARVVPSETNRLALPIDEIASRYLAGESEAAIALSLGCARKPIRNALISRGVAIRSASQANRLRMAKMTAEGRRELVADARKSRFANMKMAAFDASIHNHSVGPGEREIAEALDAIGYKTARQEMVGPYCVDILVGNVAVEVKCLTRMTFGLNERRDRQKYIFDRGMSMIFVVVDSVETLSRALDQIVAFIDGVCRNPPAQRKQWVVRCRLYKASSDRKRYDAAGIERPPHVVTTISEMNPR